MFNILAMAPNPWFGTWMNRQQLLSRLGRHNGVVYTTGLPTAWGFRLLRVLDRGSVAKADNVYVDSPPGHLVRWPSKPRYDRWIVERYAKRLDRIADSELSGGTRLLYLFHPQFLDYSEYLSFDRLIYHAYDLHSAAPGWSSKLESKENTLLERADLVVASSKPLGETLAERCDRSVIVVPNGVDFDAFRMRSDETSPPDDMASIPRPRIGYVGHLNHKVDIRLIRSVAEQRPDWSIVLLGAYSRLRPDQEGDYENLGNLPNVHILGSRSRTALPSYVNALDLGLLTYDINGTWARYCYPLKLHEYLAAGLPVVSADLPVMEDFEHVVRIARSPDEWIRQIESALADDSADARAERIRVAADNSWDSQTRLLERHLEDIS